MNVYAVSHLSKTGSGVLALMTCMDYWCFHFIGTFQPESELVDALYQTAGISMNIFIPGDSQ